MVHLLTVGLTLALTIETTALATPRRALLFGTSCDATNQQCLQALQQRGFSVELLPPDKRPEDTCSETLTYTFQPATGMLKRVAGPQAAPEAPSWIPLQDEQESLLVRQGWSFLDTDDSEPQSSFDIDAANAERTYQPKWGQVNEDYEATSKDNHKHFQLSALGWDITPWTRERVQKAVQDNIVKESTKRVLLQGYTDLPGVKQSNNGYRLVGSVHDMPDGIFTSAVTGIPLFTTKDLLLTTASAGWLSFVPESGRLLDHHVQRIVPPSEAVDQRTEVVETASGCHLGHYFSGDSYCINASCLHFIPLSPQQQQQQQQQQQYNHLTFLQGPASYRLWESIGATDDSPSGRLLIQAINDYMVSSHSYTSIVLGAGCFWSVEAALRRLPGVVTTCVGYAGGTQPHPTYEHVCSRERSDGYAEVVKVTFDPSILPLRHLVDCFLALHDPTKVRAHGKHAPLTGHYRSCVFCSEPTHVSIVREAIQDCQTALQKDVCTQVATDVKFWKAEDRHQRYEERRNDRITETTTLSTKEWLAQYGRRKPSMVGSAQTLEESVAESRFYI